MPRRDSEREPKPATTRAKATAEAATSLLVGVSPACLAALEREAASRGFKSVEALAARLLEHHARQKDETRAAPRAPLEALFGLSGSEASGDEASGDAATRAGSAGSGASARGRDGITFSRIQERTATTTKARSKYLARLSEVETE
jgi:hypothetical protein